MMMTHTVYSRGYTALNSMDEELQFLPNRNYLFDLEYLTLVTVKGGKASEFLQGQLSCDIRKVNPFQMQQGILCNVKGRILALLDVIYLSEDSYGYVIPKDLQSIGHKAMSRAAMLQRTTLEEAQNTQIFGFYAKNMSNDSPFAFELPTERYALIKKDQYQIYKIDDDFYTIIAEPSWMSQIKAAFAQGSQLRGSLAWHALQLQKMRPEIYPETSALFLPNRLNLHQTGYINFQKGCYKGQEIIARIHYRATQKHQLECFTYPANTPIEPELSLSNEKETKTVKVIDYCPIEKDKVLILASMEV